MKTKLKKTRYTGVYEYQSTREKIYGKPDRCFYITYKYNGKQHREKIGWVSEGYSAKTASYIRAERIRNIRHGDELPWEKKEIPTFEDVTMKYLEWAKDNKADRGRDDFYRYRKHIKNDLGNMRLDKITPFHLEKLKSKLKAKGLAPATVNHCLKLIRQIFNKAIAWGLYGGENPVKKVKLFKLNNKRERFLTHEEADLLLKELSKISPQLHDMALISLHCGLRAGEIFNLKSQDVDFKNGIINVSNPKNMESRKAYMTQAVKEMLLSYMPMEPDEYIFKNKKDEKIKEISKSFARIVKRLGWNDGVNDPRQKVTFHTLRHTFASWLAIQGESILTIKDLLGHKSPGITMQYAHLAPNKKRQAALKLEEEFEKGKKKNTEAVVMIKSAG